MGQIPDESKDHDPKDCWKHSFPKANGAEHKESHHKVELFLVVQGPESGYKESAIVERMSGRVQNQAEPLSHREILYPCNQGS